MVCCQTSPFHDIQVEWCTAGDHIFGLLALMASRLNGAGGTAAGVEDPRTQINAENPDPDEVRGFCPVLFHPNLTLTPTAGF
jgi:hypothetical protein